jgi:ATP-dependent Clp protease ATP-binding subunit ClpB
MEKAHPDVQHPAAAMPDDGRLTDSKAMVNFRNTIIIFTQHRFPRRSRLWTPWTQGDQSAVMAQLKARFRPEFLNRIDEFVTFQSLVWSKAEAHSSARAKVEKRLRTASCA